MKKTKAKKLKGRSVAENVRGPRTDELFGFLVGEVKIIESKKPKATEDPSTATRGIAS